MVQGVGFWAYVILQPCMECTGEMLVEIAVNTAGPYIMSSLGFLCSSFLGFLSF